MEEQARDGAKEYNGGEHLKGEDVAKAVHPSHEVPKEEEAAFAGETKEGNKAFPDGVKGRGNAVYFENEVG